MTENPTPAARPAVTARELRHLLFDIDDQALTVRELRGLLFDIEAQDEPVDLSTIRRTK